MPIESKVVSVTKSIGLAARNQEMLCFLLACGDDLDCLVAAGRKDAVLGPQQVVQRPVLQVFMDEEAIARREVVPLRRMGKSSANRMR